MIEEFFLRSALKQMDDYKRLGDETFAQLKHEDFYFQPNEEVNSIAITITHMHGNMLSRWTNFLTEDGEKEWRKRDAEFIDNHLSTDELINLWNQGWRLVLSTLGSLQKSDLMKTVFIRSKPLYVIDAIHRQLTHYAYHVGQIVQLGKIIKAAEWSSLSIPRGASEMYNTQIGHVK